MAHGDLLLAFADAVILGPHADLVAARERVLGTLGEAALVDAAATIASFNAVVRLADASGIPIEAHKHEVVEALEESLGPRAAWFRS